MSNGRFGGGRPPGEPGDGPDEPYGIYTRALRRAVEANRRLSEAVAAEREDAPARVNELLEHPRDQRWPLVLWRSRYQRFSVAERLLNLCRDTWSRDPIEAGSLAHLAVSVLDVMGADARSRLRPGRQRRSSADIPLPEVHEDLYARAWSYIANCRRIGSDLKRVPEAFRRARYHLDRGGGDPVDEVAVLDLEASYFIDLRRFDEAEAALEQAIALYREAGERHQEGRALINLARLRHEQGRPREAIPLFEEAGRKIDGAREPYLERIVTCGLALCFAETDQHIEAHGLLAKLDRMVSEIEERHEQLRVEWIRGLVNHHLGERDLAVEAIDRARAGFAASGIAYDAALATLDLALVYLDSGDLERACALATELAPVFTARGVQREALAVLAIVHRAMEEKALTRQLVHHTASLLRRINRRQ